MFDRGQDVKNRAQTDFATLNKTYMFGKKHHRNSQHRIRVQYNIIGVGPGRLGNLEGLVPVAKFRKAPLEHENPERSTDTKNTFCQTKRPRKSSRRRTKECAPVTRPKHLRTH